MSGEEGEKFEIPVIVDYKSSTEEATYSSEKVTKVDSEQVNRLKELNLNDLLNVTLNGTENLKNNFSAIIEVIG